VNPSAADWQLLEIAPTEDGRAIRVAYARQLKAIDPEADPKSFIALRSAYERASGRTSAPVEVEPPSGPSQLDDGAERHAEAILALFREHSDPRPWLAPAAQEQLIAHWQAIAADPRLERLDYAARVEHWAAAIIAQAAPLSAPILMLAAERFGWIDADKNVHSSPYLIDIARRYRMLQLLHTAARPGSRYHSAWVELHKPANSFFGSKGLNPPRIYEVIAAMRYALPQLGEEFDQIRLEAWEIRAATGYVAPMRTISGWLSVALVIWLVLAAFAFLLAWITT
jgi:hypothetical protein